MKRTLNILGMAVAVAVLATQHSFAQEKTLPLAEARAKIGVIVENPASMTEVMMHLSAADQVSFLADVNAAITKMPGSGEERAAKFLNVNRAALKGAAKGNLANLVAEVFATVPPEALPLITERFAADVFNRKADSARVYSDEEFIHIATNLMARIESRTSGADDANVRNTFATTMLVKASSGGATVSVDSPLVDALLGTFSDGEARKLAKTEWLPAALAPQPNYEPMLAEADTGVQVNQINPVVALQISGPQLVDVVLSDVSSSLVDSQGRETTPFTDQLIEGGDISANLVVQGSTNADPSSSSTSSGEPPRTDDPTKPWNPDAPRDEPVKPEPTPTPTPPEPEPEPTPYP